jgi:hypothetical protein
MMGFTPAGQMEDFFTLSSKQPVDAKIAEAHGMKWLGPPIIARGDRRWLIRVYLGRDYETNKRNYHNRTIHGSMREAQSYLTRKLRERDLGRDLEGAKITLNEYLDRWLRTAVKPRVREDL